MEFFIKKNLKASSLKTQFINFFLLIFLISGLLIVSAVYLTLNSKTQETGRNFAVEYALKEKNRIMVLIQRELALSRKMADSPLLINWVLDEYNQNIKELALQELNSYRRYFSDQRYFIVVDKSKNYYFNNRENQYKGNELIYTLDEANSDDKWYYTTMKEVDNYNLNVDDNAILEETNIWINTIIRDSNGDKIGLAGTGINLAGYLRDFIENNSDIVPIIFDSNGAIQAYNDPELIDKNSITKAPSERSTIFNMVESFEDKNNILKVMDLLKNSEEDVKTVDISFNNDRYVAAITYLPEIDWYVTTLFQLSSIYSIWDYKNVILIIIFLVLVIIIMILFFTNKMVLNPLNKLNISTQEISSGNYDYQVDIETDNEIGALASSFNEMAARVQEYTVNLEKLVQERTEELKVANQILEDRNKKITDSILYAQNIQNSILPERDILKKSFNDFFVIWEPRDIVGGDFYWYKEFNDGYYVAVIDCTGHGVPGALMAMTANAILQRITETTDDITPAEILSHLNRLMKKVLYSNNANKNIDDGLDIAMCKVIPDNKKCTFAGARLSLFYTEGGNLVRIKGDIQSIGYRRSSESYTYKNHCLKVSDNSKFYLTTDGFLDQNGGKDNKRIGLKGFIKLINENKKMNLHKQGEIFEEKLKKHMINTEQRDDITVLGFKVY